MKTAFSQVSYLFVTLSFIFILDFPGTGHAQNLIARQTGSTTNFHIELDDAITKASNGDIIYLPGGYFPLNVPIDKELHIIGTGHHPGYSTASGVTYIGGNVYLNAGASRSSFEGIYFQSTISVNEVTLSNLMFKRCILEHFNYNGQHPEIELKYSSFIENVIRGGINLSILQSSFFNNIFTDYWYRGSVDCIFKNNLFLSDQRFISNWPNSYFVYSIAGMLNRFENNIFSASGTSLSATGNSVFIKNLFASSIVFDGINLIGFDNYIDQPEESIFKKLSGRSFLYTENFHLNEQYKNTWIGTDGAEIGIYGGPSPWKDNCFPFNPQIISKSVAGYTNPDGTLKVSIQVAAQER